MYFIANIIAVIIYASLSCGLYLGADYISNELLKKAYSWIFLTTYFMQFTRLGILPILSIGIFHVILLISVFVAPIGLGWIKQAKLESEIEMEELLERVPGRLEVNPLEDKTLENENNSSEKEVKI